VVTTRSAAAFSAALGSFNADVLYVSTTHVYGDAFRDDDPLEVHAGIGGYNEGAWWHHTVDPLDAAVLDITKLEALVIPCNFVVFDHRLPQGAELTNSQIAVHGDGLASVVNLPKSRVPNSEMRIVRDITLDLPQFKSRQDSIVVAHTYGLGNPADAPSRNLQSDIIDSCRALGIRSRYMPTVARQWLMTS